MSDRDISLAEQIEWLGVTAGAFRSDSPEYARCRAVIWSLVELAAWRGVPEEVPVAGKDAELAHYRGLANNWKQSFIDKDAELATAKCQLDIAQTAEELQREIAAKFVHESDNAHKEIERLEENIKRLGVCKTCGGDGFICDEPVHPGPPRQCPECGGVGLHEYELRLRAKDAELAKAKADLSAVRVMLGDVNRLAGERRVALESANAEIERRKADMLQANTYGADLANKLAKAEYKIEQLNSQRPAPDTECERLAKWCESHGTAFKDTAIGNVHYDNLLRIAAILRSIEERKEPTK